MSNKGLPIYSVSFTPFEQSYLTDTVRALLFLLGVATISRVPHRMPSATLTHKHESEQLSIALLIYHSLIKAAPYYPLSVFFMVVTSS